MDALRRDDIARARQTPPAEKLLQALRLMETAIELKRTQLRLRHPGADEAGIEAELDRWMSARE